MSRQPRIRLYLALSIDGYIADAKGGVDWLHPYENEEVGFKAFLTEIDIIISGRATYEQAVGFGEWPYSGKRVVVLTNRPLAASTPAGVERSSGDIRKLAATLKQDSQRDIWLLGGALVAQDFLAADLIDTFELYVVPVILGDGIRLFGRAETARTLRLIDTRHHNNGIVGLIYARG